MAKKDIITIVVSLITTILVLTFTFIWARGKLINDKATYEYVNRQDDSIKKEVSRVEKTAKENLDAHKEESKTREELMLEMMRDIREDVKYIRRKDR